MSDAKLTDVEAVMAQSLREYVAGINPVVEHYVTPYLTGAVQRLTADLGKAGYQVAWNPSDKAIAAEE